MKVALVRGSYLNNFESQNYASLGKDIQITAIASRRSIHQKFPFKVKLLLSLADVGMPTWIANRTIGDRQILFGLEKAVEGFDIVHTADPHYYYTYQLAKLRKEGKVKKLISTSWETIPFNNESVAAKKQIKYFSMKYIDHFLCYTERAKKCLVTEGVKSQKITVIPLGIDLNQFKPAFKIIHKAKSSKIRLLFTGRDVPEKGLSDLRKAIKHLIELNKVELLVAGNIPYDKMPNVYRLADIFIMPSKTSKTWEEQYGMSLVEAMASGLPIIAYDSGSIPELLGNVGITIEEGDIKGLNRNLTGLINSPKKLKALGLMARRRAEKYFNSKNFAKKLSTFYRSVANR